MSATSTIPIATTPIATTQNLTPQLCELGFVRDGSRLRQNGMTAGIDRCWLTLCTRAEQGNRRGPGLWKTVDGEGAKSQHREFHLPLALIGQESWDDETGEPLDTLSELIQWAHLTAAGKLPENWKCPDEKQLTESLPNGAFTVEAGPYVRQGQLHCEAQRLSVQFPLLPALPADLDVSRRAWLQAMLADGQNRCRLVRLVEQETEEQPTRILAEVDLTGVPQFAVTRLVRIGLDAVRHVVSQMIAAFELLVDPTVTSTVWEFSPLQDQAAESKGGNSCRFDKNRP